MSMFSAFALALAGFAALAMSLDRHYADIHGRGNAPAAGTVRVLHAVGWPALALTWAICIAAEGWSLGTLFWVGTMTASGFVIVLVLAYRPRAIPRILPWAAGVGVGGMAIQWLIAS